MSSANFNLKGIPAEVMTLLKKESKRLRISVNSLVLKMIERGLGVKREKLIYHDLDHLAGSWTAEDEKEFKENVRPFEQNITFNESDRI